MKPLADLVQQVGGERWWSDAAPALAALPCAISRIVDGNPGLVAQVLGAGTAMLPAHRFTGLADAALAELAPDLAAAFPDSAVPSTATEVIAAIGNLPSQVWPATAGLPLFLCADSVVIDVSAATRHLELALEQPADPDHAAVAAKLFEFAAQAVIDASSWHQADLAAHRGETVNRDDGSAITDLDAIGGKTQRAILVDCKSYIYRGGYEAGPSGVMLNAATAIAGKATHMKDVVLPDIDDHPPAFLAAFPTRIGVVCTPIPIYTEIGDATEEAAPGLRRAVSLFELRDWLKQN